LLYTCISFVLCTTLATLVLVSLCGLLE